MSSSSIGKLDSTGESAASYAYSPLAFSSTQFRIFTLQPSSDTNAPLQGSLRVEALQTQDGRTCAYEALSYVWGQEIDANPLAITNSGNIRITQNLAHALRYIRQPSEPRDLWIDALCIDQGNALEKNHQVRRMYRIFASASRVIIWLGLADEDSEYALTHLENLKTVSPENLPRITTIFERPWVSRMWTFQEALAASADSIVMCGSTIASWKNMLRALRELSARAKHNPDASIYRLRYFLDAHTLHTMSHRLTLDKLIMASSDRHATDPRDYIFALLGLINDGMLEDIEPDYTSPVSAIFQEAMVRIYRSHGRLDALINHLILSEHSGHISWYLNFHERGAFRDVDDHYLSRRFSVMYNGAANGIPLAEITHNVENSSIKLVGAVIGIVANSSRLLFPKCGLPQCEDPGSGRGTPVGNCLHETVYELFCQIRRITAMARKEWEYESPHIADLKVDAGHVWKLIANGRHMENLLNKYPVKDELYQCFRWLEHCVAMWPKGEAATYGILPSTNKSEPILSPLKGEKHDASRVLVDWLRGITSGNTRRALDALYSIAASVYRGINLITVSGGYVGSSYHNIMVGDVLCILRGCRIPLVLRKDDEDCYHIIGPAYVDGLMQAERFEAGATVEWADFVIK